MKKEEFKKLVRPIIKEELYKVLSDVLPSLLSEVVADQIVPKSQPQQKTHPTPKQPLRISNDPLLNEIFAQTKGGISNGSEMVGLDGDMSMGGAMYGNPMDDAGYVDYDSEQQQYSAGEHGQQIGIEQLQEVAPEVAKALTRDYSQLLKAVDNKKQSVGPSNIDFTKYNG